ncbi:G protein subunit beta KNAG_0A03220 [Huiozyma naganishii CBS 8797]|uniref:Uncharacterized protein n=1 Tax=Huiozyma naganishii (strain ATCC MYA-139 / BCRC 22969 / CBS 8797 / KCTC 17520 / NBRC 10181 / NCYC 3082 / Yp74L-3) TaxID=1071383 RepID=J7S280_HUIN7|nr:hypothetical protein KNAG_0A03220 [Kazachstania naganishii CBS 8797]CCK68009.1 hypothetical protein KNAG_0A03220 [Kazachstania naganishii CBS 8797]
MTSRYNFTQSPPIQQDFYAEQQTAMLQDYQMVEDDIEQQITLARNDTKNLYTQIDKVKKKIQDSSLLEMTTRVPPLNKNSINLKATIDLKGHNNKIADFRWSRNSKNILSASQDGFMLLWDVATGLKQNAIPLTSQWVLSCALSPSGNLAASAGLDNNCTVYKISKENRIQQNVITIFKGHTGYISSIDFLDERQILSASGDMTCALWDIPKAKRIREYTDHLGDVLALALPHNDNANGKIFASCGSDGYLYIWDTRSPANAQSFFISSSDASSLQFFRDDNSIIAGSENGTISMFDLRSDCRLEEYALSSGLSKNLETPTYSAASMEYRKMIPESMAISSIPTGYLDSQGVVSLDFSSSGRLMYACYTDMGCLVWDLLKAEVVGKLEGHSNRVSGMRTSPDGLAVCTGSWDSTMKIWFPAYN